MLITHYQRVFFQVSGRNVDAKRGNPLIRKYRKALEELKVKQSSVSAYVYDVDGFDIWQKNKDLYEGKYTIRWEITDNETGWESRMNHDTKALLMRELLAINFSRYATRITTINIKDGSYEQ